MINIPIIIGEKEHYLTSNKDEFRLSVIEVHKGRTRHDIKGHFFTLDGVLQFIFKLKIMDCDATTLIELLIVIQKLRLEIAELTLLCKEE